MKTKTASCLNGNVSKNYFLSLNSKIIILLLVSFTAAISVHAQQITEVITDYNGFWKSGTAAVNPVYPNTSHNVLSFKYNNVNYSTGVNNVKLNDSSITYVPANFQAFPVATVGGYVTSGVYIALAGNYDGVPNGYSNPLPSLKIKDVLIDGIHGLNLGTGVTNVPASALINFPVNGIASSAIADSIPDILVSQIASPSSNGDTLYFVNSSGVVVGNKIAINWLLYNALGMYYLDLYTLPVGALCDTAKINGTSMANTTRDIRLIAFKLSDFGITTVNAASISNFVLKASGTSDPAFIAYNAGAFTIPAPVITVQPLTQIICPNAANSVTLSVTATGSGLSYQWRKNGVDIPGAVSATYTISNVITSSAGAYSVIVTNSAGAVSSEIAYLNISIAVQPSPVTQTLATGVSDTLMVSANNATSYQWKRNGVAVFGATDPVYILNPVTTANAGSYSVLIGNAANGGCVSVLSSAVTVIAATTLYSKPGVSLNLPASWGVATNGTGSSPVNFTRAEHTFIVKNNAITGGDLSIAGILDLASAVTTISSNSTLTAGRIIRSGSGALAGSATSSLRVRDTSMLTFQSGNNMIKDLTVDGGYVTITNALSITGGSFPGTVTINTGTLNTSDNLTFKSNINGTARLAPLSLLASVSGKAIVEHYITANRGWRLLSVPVSSINAPTINEAWQEGLTTASSNPDLFPGYGIKIAGGTTANGFDQSNTNAAFIKLYNSVTNANVAIPSIPGTYIPITTNPAYFVYIRGDRSINLMQGTNAGITSTVLRTKGYLNMQDQSVIVSPVNYTLVGNPYPSAIDFSTVTRVNVNNSFYVWDPKMAGNYGVGGYVTISWNTNTNSYDKTTSVSPAGQYIASGDAVFVSATNHLIPGALIIKETDKTGSVNAPASRVAGVDQKLRVNLYSADSANTSSLLDGVLITYADINTNEIDADDANKLYGSNQSINILSKGKTLAIERRKTIGESDTCFLNLYQMKVHDYFLEVSTENLDNHNNIAVLKDNYSNTINNTVLDLHGTTTIPFSITADPASAAVNRFSIVFQPLAILPVTFKLVKAYAETRNIIVEWIMDDETDVEHYEVERSVDGRLFTKINITAATARTAENVKYRFTDLHPEDGHNYYRIRAVKKDRQAQYSTVVEGDMNKLPVNPSFTVSPNPVTGNTILLQFSNIKKGNYIVQLFNVSGQMVASKSIRYAANNTTEEFEVPENFPGGNYKLKLTGELINLNTSLIKR